MAENTSKSSNKASIDLEIKLPNVDKPFYNKLSTESNMFTQIKKAGSKLDENQNLDVWINNNKNIKLSKADILNDNLKENVNERISVLDKLEKAERTAVSLNIKYASDLDDKGIKTYHVNGNSKTDENGFIELVSQTEVKHHKQESDKWAMELSNRTDVSKGLTMSQIDEKQAFHYSIYESKSKELGLEVTPFISEKQNIPSAALDSEKDVVGKITYVDSGEVMEFTKKEDYIDSIKDQLEYNSPPSFKAETVLREPELLKKVDDIYYGHSGEDNPNTIEYYKEKVNAENPNTNKGTEQSQQPQQELSETQSKNLSFLKDQIKYLGFGEDPNLHKELTEKFNSNAKEFSVNLTSDKATFHKTDFQLNFNRSESTGRVFFNSFDTTLSNDKRNVSVSQNFSTTKENFTAKESINLLEGRSVKTEIERNGVKETAFVELKLKEEKNQYGNFQKQHYYQNYGTDAAKALSKEKFIFQDDKHKDITIKSLEKGNVVNAKFINPQTDKEITGKAVLNVAYKTVNLYDENMKRLNGNEKAFVKDLGESEENNTRKQQSQSRSM